MSECIWLRRHRKNENIQMFCNKLLLENKCAHAYAMEIWDKLAGSDMIKLGQYIQLSNHLISNGDPFGTYSKNQLCSRVRTHTRRIEHQFTIDIARINCPIVSISFSWFSQWILFNVDFITDIDRSHTAAKRYLIDFRVERICGPHLIRRKLHIKAKKKFNRSPLRHTLDFTA